MPQLSIRLPENMYKLLKKEAEKQRRSLNSQIIKTLEDRLEEKENIQSGKTQIDVNALQGGQG